MQWYPGVEGAEALTQATGRRGGAASSSPTFLSAARGDGAGLRAEGGPGGEARGVGVARLPASSLPQLEEAVGTVDWSWVVGSTVRAASLAEGRLRLDLEPAGPLTVSAALWQGAPF